MIRLGTTLQGRMEYEFAKYIETSDSEISSKIIYRILYV